MRNFRSAILGLYLFFLGTSNNNSPIPPQDAKLPQSRAESSDYRETSRFEDVTRFLSAVAAESKVARVTSIGATSEGRSIPLVILADPPVADPVGVRRSPRLRIFIMANIHAGEVEGKEASLHLIREIALGPLRPLLKNLMILVAPIYNADGNERISPSNRTNQKGPPGGVGTRENAQGLDLNRDFVKLETPEANALVGRVFNALDPQVIIDLHTTNGSYHGYALTFAPPLNLDGDERLIQMTRGVMLPAIRREMKNRYQYETYFYGNFIDENHPEKGWATFDHRPRFGNNYVGLRNRITILSEAYAYADFRTRVDVTQKFVQSILEYSDQHARELTWAVTDADLRMKNPSAGKARSLGIKFALQPLSETVEILGNKVVAEIDPKTGKEAFRRTDKLVSYRTQDFGAFEATEKRTLPRYYFIEPGQRTIIEKLRAHGIVLERIPRRLKARIEVFRVAKLERSPRPFQKHNEVTLTGEWRKESRELVRGTYRVRTTQPLGNLIFYLLEPESDDGLATWNFFDTALGDLPADFPVYRSTRNGNGRRSAIHGRKILASRKGAIESEQ